jgi:hypothetical protein
MGIFINVIMKNLTKYFTQCFIIFFLSFCFNACSKNIGKHIVIDLEEKHLKDTPSGSWLDIFDIDYLFISKRLKKQISDILIEEGELIDEYVWEDNENVVKSYIYQYKNYEILLEYYDGGIWTGPKVIPFQEYYNGGWNSWITINFKKGIPYAELLPNHYKDLSPNRKYEHSVTIESKIDQERRLFLFGYGSTCKRISLF